MSIRARFAPAGHVARPEEDRHVLATVTYTDAARLTLTDHGNPDLSVPMAVTGGDPFREVWTVAGRPRWALRDGLAYAHDGEHLFIAGLLPEQDVYTPPVRALYEKAFALVNHLDYEHIFRMWNFVGDIVGTNAEGMEVYQDFVQGRAQAFQTYMGSGTAELPAATGIGTQGRGIALLLLASRGRGVPRHVENSRQTSAYHYPDQYGPKAPSFARATFLGDTLYVSGTASILGHETVHRGDVRRQTRETLDNIAHLISGDNLAAQGIEAAHSLKDLRLIKAYVRHEEDIETVRAVCEEALGAGVEVKYLNVAVCRDDLLVEIEGIVPGQGWDL